MYMHPEYCEMLSMHVCMASLMTFLILCFSTFGAQVSSHSLIILAHLLFGSIQWMYLYHTSDC